MTENEYELLNIVRGSTDPNALVKATAIIIDFLKQLESFEGQASAETQGLS